jgi:hypothetical protein
MFAIGNILMSASFPLDGAIVAPISACIIASSEVFISNVPALTPEQKLAFNCALTNFIGCLKTYFNTASFIEGTELQLNQFIGSINVVIKQNSDSKAYGFACVGSGQFSFVNESERDKLFERVKKVFMGYYQV